MKIKIALAGATGWAGSAIAAAIPYHNDLDLVSAITSSKHDKNLGEILNIPNLNVPIFDKVQDAFTIPANVLIDYTHPTIVKSHVLTAIQQGVNVIVGTSGLDDSDYEEIHEAALNANVGVIASGNFAITAVLLQHFALIAARFVPNCEIIDYASADKVDAPSGTVRQLAYRLGQVKKPLLKALIEETEGIKETRGATINGTQVHSIRLPGYTLAAEAIFGGNDEKLVIRHEAGNSAAPYVAGTLLAVRKVMHIKGLVRGLDQVMDLGSV